MIEKIFKENEIQITKEQCRKFEQYYQLLIEWNEKVNLTSIIEYEDVIWKHFIDSALLVKSSRFVKEEDTNVLDVGTGAGFPGIVLAILCPNYQFTLLDSLNKRIDFLKIVQTELNLNNVSLYHGRSEDFGKMEEFRNQFDFVVSRAVAELPILLEYCVPFVKEQGYFVSYKGKKYEEEIQHSQNALKVLNSEVEDVEEYKLRNDDEKRFLLFVRNLDVTDIHYPRKAGKARKQPL